MGSLAGPCLRGLLVELGLKLVYGGLGSRTEGAGLWLGWAGPVSDTSDRPGQQADWAGLDAS